MSAIVKKSLLIGWLLIALLAGAGLALADGTNGNTDPIPDPDPDPENPPETLASPDPNLHFNLGEETIFVRGTVTDPDTLAQITLQVYFDDTPPAGAMSSMVFRFAFDDTKILFSGVEPQNWDGGFAYFYRVGANAFDTLELTFEGGIEPAPGDSTVYAVITYKAKCQNENTTNDLIFNKTDWVYNNVEVGGYHYWPGQPGCWRDGKVISENYTSTLSIDSITVIGALDSEIVVPVRGQTNFRIYGVEHLIGYDNTKLNFLGVEDYEDVFPGGCFGECAPGSNPVHIYLFTYPDPPHDPLPAGTEIYRLRFKVIGNWEGQSTTLTFAPIMDVTFVGMDGGYCDALSQSSDFYNPGLVDLQGYRDTVKASFVDRTVGKNDDEAWVQIQMKHNFPAGNGVDDTKDSAIIVNFDLGSYFKTPYLIDPLTDEFDFEAYTYQNGSIGLSVRQKYSSSLLNRRGITGDFTDIFGLELEFNGAAYTPVYSNRFIKLKYADRFNGAVNVRSHVKDVTGRVTCDSTSGKMAFQTDSVEVLMARFYAPSASVGGSSYCVSHDLFVKNNVLIDTLSVSVNIGQNHVISSVTTYGNIGKVYVNSRKYKIHSTSAFQLGPNGEDSTKIATIRYCTVNRCMKPTQTYTCSYVTLTEPLVKDDNHVEQYTEVLSSLICSKCNYYIEDTIIVDPGLDKLQQAQLPTEFKLNQNHPNPFNPETIISYDVPSAARVKIVVMNILGQVVATLVDEPKSPGRYEIVWRGTDSYGARVSSGVYLAVMKADKYSGSIKMSLMK